MSSSTAQLDTPPFAVDIDRDAPLSGRVLFINRSFWPDAEATGQLLDELCQDLSTRFDVRVIAGQPNQNPEQAAYQRRGWDRRHAVSVRRVWHTRLPKQWMLGRAINYISFLFSATFAAICAPRADVVVVETDPPLLCFVGALVRRFRGSQLVVYLQDIYPDIAVALGKLPDGLLVGWLRRAMFAVYRRADRVIVLSRDMRDLLIRSGVPESRIECVPNWVDTDKLRSIKHNNAFRRRHNLEDQFVVMYSGNLGLCQRLEDVIEAARLLRGTPEIVFLLIGDGSLKARLVELVDHEQLDNVRFLPYQSKAELSESLSAADIHLVPLDPRVASCLMPSKLYGALASGTPVLAVAPAECELAELVESQQVGMACPPEDPEQLAAAIQRLMFSRDLLAEWGQRAREVAVNLFDRRQASAAFEGVLHRIVHTNEPSEISIQDSASSRDAAAVDGVIQSAFSVSSK